MQTAGRDTNAVQTSSKMSCRFLVPGSCILCRCYYTENGGAEGFRGSPWLAVEGGKVLSLFGIRSAYHYLATVCFCGSVVFLVGCGDSGGTKLVPVAGKVTVDGKPLTTGTGKLSCRPVKGSATSQQPAADIEEDGTYRLVTDGKEGAPPGRYQVLVVDVEPRDPKDPFPYGPRKTHVNLKYGNPKTSDMYIEVAPSPAPGAYDLKLTK